MCGLTRMKKSGASKLWLSDDLNTVNFQRSPVSFWKGRLRKHEAEYSVCGNEPKRIWTKRYGTSVLLFFGGRSTMAQDSWRAVRRYVCDYCSSIPLGGRRAKLFRRYHHHSWMYPSPRFQYVLIWRRRDLKTPGDERLRRATRVLRRPWQS